MAQSDQKVADRVYEDFEPSYEWTEDEESDTIILLLRGFKRENLRVQISANRILKLRGEQQISENKWLRFNKEFTIPPNSNTNGIKAKLEGGLLYIRLPKGITEVKPATKSSTQEEPKASEVAQKKPQEEKEQPSYQTKEEERVGEDDNSVVQDRAKATSSEEHEMYETIGGLGKGDEKNVRKRIPTTTTLYGYIRELGMEKKLAKLLVVIFLVIVMGMHVKNAIFGGSRIQEF